MEENKQEGDQAEWDEGDQSSLQPDALAIQQLLNSDSMPNGIGPGEVMYVMVGSTTYQITGPQEEGGEVTITPVTNLEELASIGAIPQEDQQEGVQQEGEEGGGAQEEEQQQEGVEEPEQQQEQQEQDQEESSEQQQYALQQQQALEGVEDHEEPTEQQLQQQQQQLAEDQQEEQSFQQDQESQQQQQQQQQEADAEETQQQQQQPESDQSMTNDQEEQLTQEHQQQLLQQQQTIQQQQLDAQNTSQHSTEAVLQQLANNSNMGVAKIEGNTISLAGGDFVLQPGQQLPPEIQEMISKGLPIDMSNFEFVVDEEPSQQHPQQQQQQQQLVNSQNEFQYRNASNNCENIPEQSDEQQPKNGIFVQVVTACPGEFDDGEFPQFPSIAQEQQRLNNSEPYIIAKSFYLQQYIDFVNGGGKLSGMSKITQQQHQQLQNYSPMQQGRSILLNNQDQNKFKRKRMMDAEDDDDDASWKLNDPKRQRAKQQRMNVMPPNISKHSSKVLSQHDMLKLHHASTAASNHLVFEMPVAYIMQNEPHNYQKGDFVVDKKDAYQAGFPMWRIESSKLLQKFEPFVENAVCLHKSASVYSSWSGDIRTNFRAVLADILSTSSAPIGRKQEIVVKVHNKYVPKPADEKLEQNALMQFFNIYVHVLLNQVFEPAYLTAIRQQNVDYYLEPMTQIDQLIGEAKQGVLLECNWNNLFQVALETWSTYTFGPLRPTDVKQQCQAVASGGAAVKVVKFYGQSYNPETLQTDQDVAIGSNRMVEFLVGRTAMASLGVYHALHHFKYLLFRRCHDEAVFQVSTQKKSSSDVPDICIQNRIWVQQMFQDLKGLLDRYIIIKTEEENAEDSPQ